MWNLKMIMARGISGFTEILGLVEIIRTLRPERTAVLEVPPEHLLEEGARQHPLRGSDRSPTRA